MTGNVVRATWSDPRHHPLSACPSSVPSGRGVPVAAAVLRACSRARPCSTWASGRLRGLAASSGLRGHPAKRRTTSRFLGASVGLEKIHLLVDQRIRHVMPSTPIPSAAVLAKPRRASRNVSDAATASLPSSTTTRFTRVDVAEVRELLTRYSRAYQLRRVTEAQDLREARMRRTFQKHSEITRMGPGLKPGDRAPGPGPGTRLDRAPCRADWPRAVRAPRPRAVPRWAQVLGSSR